MRIVAYGICGRGEAKRHLKEVLESLRPLSDEIIILGNRIGDEERKLIKKYAHLVEDNREWGKNQHRLKYDFVKNHVAKLNPDACICVDMDEILIAERGKIEEWLQKGQAWYVYIVNLWNDGWRQDWSFWNVRIWKWDWMEKMGDSFWEFENRPLHCGLAPKWCYHLNLYAPFMLLHYGLQLKSDRDKKIARYEKYDPTQKYRAKQYYQALEIDEAMPFNQEELQNQLDNHIDSIHQPLNKQLAFMTKKKKQFMVVREFDNFTFPVDEMVLPSQLQQKFKGMGFRLIGEAQEVKPKPTIATPKVNELECQFCGFIGKTEASLKAHTTKTGHK